MDKNDKKRNAEIAEEAVSVMITNGFICDRLRILSAEYSMPVEDLVNIAVKHMLDDVDFVRGLRKKKVEHL